jgi:HAD superfamily hydrolase (TIGR01509 family)
MRGFMNVKAAIFDMDGTLLDSMSIWSNLCREFLLRHNIDREIDLEGKLGVISMRNAIEYVIREFEMDISPDEAYAENWKIVEEFYLTKVQLKPGIMAILNRLREKEIPCGVITATETGLAVPVLERLGLRQCFREIFSCAEMQTSKRIPDVFYKMSRHLGAEPSETIVFEDALYAAVTAKNAGYSVAAVYDPSETKPRDLSETADWYCQTWEDFPLNVL